MVDLEDPASSVCKIRYTTNWMGVANLQWYRDRDLLKKTTITFTESSLTVRHGRYRPGDTIEVEEPIERYSCGRIDIRGTGDPYGHELAVPPMRDEDWRRFGHWLNTVETDAVWTLDQLVAVYERTNPGIQWWRDHDDH